MLGSEPRRRKRTVYEERLALERKRFARPGREVTPSELDLLPRRDAMPGLESAGFSVSEYSWIEDPNVDAARLSSRRETEEIDRGLAHRRAQRLRRVILRRGRDRTLVS